MAEKSPHAPKYRTKSVTLPATGYSVRSFTMRELTGADELEVARAVDARLTSAYRGGVMAMMEAKSQEAQRLAIVEVNGEAVNHMVVPFVAFDEWNQRTRAVATRVFNALNAVEDEDSKYIEAQLAKEDAAAPVPKIQLVPEGDEEDAGEKPTAV